LKLSEPELQGMKRYPSQKLAARTLLFYLKNSVENGQNKNVKTRKIVNILETAGNITESSNFSRRRYFKVVYCTMNDYWF